MFLFCFVLFFILFCFVLFVCFVFCFCLFLFVCLFCFCLFVFSLIIIIIWPKKIPAQYQGQISHFVILSHFHHVHGNSIHGTMTISVEYKKKTVSAFSTICKIRKGGKLILCQDFLCCISLINDIIFSSLS